MKNITLRISIFLFSILYFNSLNAQSLATTVEYIENKLSSCTVDTGIWLNKFSGSYSSDDYCEFRMLSKGSYRSDRCNTTSVFRFEDLDPDNITVELRNQDSNPYYEMKIFSRDELDLIKLESYCYNERETFIRSFLRIECYDKTTIKRLKKAFIRAINLCEERDPFAD